MSDEEARTKAITATLDMAFESIRQEIAAVGFWVNRPTLAESC